MSIIEVDHLTKDYGSKRGVFDVSFKIEKGEVFGFLGPNGAGKSTTIRHLMGFSKPDLGRTCILGFDSFKEYNNALRNVGYIPGEIALPQGLKGYEFLQMMQNLEGNQNNKRLEEMLDRFKLDKETLNMETKHMSLGVKRKLAVVRAFMSDPEVYIFDEPTSGLDPVMQNEFIKLVMEEKAKGKTILLSSHIFSEVDQTCDRISIIKDGSIVSNFIANDLKHKTKKLYHLFFNDKGEYSSFLNPKSWTTVIEQDPDKCSILVEVDDKDVNQLITECSKYDLKDFIHKKETLEDYFMKFYKEDKNFKGAL